MIPTKVVMRVCEIINFSPLLFGWRAESSKIGIDRNFHYTVPFDRSRNAKYTGGAMADGQCRWICAAANLREKK